MEHVTGTQKVQTTPAVLLNIKMCSCKLLIVTEFDHSTDLLALAVAWPGPKGLKHKKQISEEVIQ